MKAECVPLEQAADESSFGAKAVNLGAALRAGFPVPPGLALSVGFVEQIAGAEASARVRLCDASDAVGYPVVVRSSAVGEDSEAASFAGQHLSLLNVVDADAVCRAVLEVRSSGHTPSAMAYRKKRGLDGPIGVAVVVQRLVDADVAGVLFTRNPVTGADERVIEASWGLGESVVAGLVTPDQFRLNREGSVLGYVAGEKDVAIRRAAGGATTELPVEPALVEAPCLDDGKLARLHELATRCEAQFGRGLDLEWAFLGDTLWLLQCRAISVTA